MKIFKSIGDCFSMIGLSMMSVFNPSILEGEIDKLESKYSKGKKIDRFKVDSRGIPVKLDMPKEIIDDIYKHFRNVGVKLTIDDWWNLQDDYKACGYVYIYDV